MCDCKKRPGSTEDIDKVRELVKSTGKEFLNKLIKNQSLEKIT